MTLPYKIALSLAIVALLLLFWVNGAIGLIGSENQPANLLYGAVFLVGIVGSLLARFKPTGMARTLFTMAAVQVAIPIVALIVWPAVSWGSAGIFGVFLLNTFFAVLFIISAFLFRRTAE